jgi:hypothetical protein
MMRGVGVGGVEGAMVAGILVGSVAGIPPARDAGG